MTVVTPGEGASNAVNPVDPRPQEQEVKIPGVRWYDSFLLIIVLLIVFFPVGIYALYLNSRLPGFAKILLALAGLALLSEFVSQIYRLAGAGLL